jgi:guanine deaminase
MASQKYSFYKGIILNPVSDLRCDYYQDGLLVVKKGKVKELVSFAEGQQKYSSYMHAKNVHDYGASLIIPGLFDMHFHWVQDDVRTMPKDSLLEWLQKYTFPTEMRYSNKSYAEKKAKTFFKKLSSTGTIGGACYSSIHENALHAAMDHAQGEFVIGNVLMNMNSPVELTQTEEESIALTKKLIKKYKRRHCFTPRFAISTSPQVMKKGSRLADQQKCFKQTHLSETPQEIEFVLSLYKKIPGFEKVKSYTDIYEKTGMLGKRSLMGHGIHLGSKELQTLKKTKTSIIHCPTSNAPIKDKGLGSGLFDFKRIEKMKIRWALGSDIGGGPFLSMFDVMRSFVEQNRSKKIEEATYVKALYRSTLAAAEILGIEKKAGNFAKNKDANFLVIPLNIKAGKDAEEVLHRLISPHKKLRENFDGLIRQTYYQGELLFNRKTAQKMVKARQTK